ncbi:MAG: site-specific integrase [Thermoleophilia bacterium]|nr:site-specific integrase [Thermoleophilia bacterium]
MSASVSGEKLMQRIFPNQRAPMPRRLHPSHRRTRPRRPRTRHRPHSLRATGAQLLVAAGASLGLVSQQLGHADDRTTKGYYVGNVSTDGLAQFDGAFG